MVGRILTLVILMISFLGLTGQTVVGDWEGELDVQGSKLKVIFHISQEAGVYSSTMDSPMQGAFDIKMDETTFEDETLTISKKEMSMKTVAKYENDAITGTFNQGPMKLPLVLTRLSKEEKTAPTNNHKMAGDWNTELNVMGTQLRLIVHITEMNGELSATMDSPDQKAFGIPMDEVSATGNDLTLASTRGGINIEGSFLPDSNIIKAKFKQGPLNEDIVFTREAIKKKEINRPQEPSSFNYKVEEVEFINMEGGHKLAGTLTIPSSGKFEKVAVLVSGSGPQDRNEELLGHKPFLVLSDHLTKNGIAVLRYDDRGVAKSGGDFSTGTSMDFTMDAIAALDYLKTRTDMKDKKFGIMGHSEGGLIAPIAADKTNLDYIVLLAGPGINSKDLLLEQTEAISRANGVPENEIDFSQKTSELIFNLMNKNSDMEIAELRSSLDVLLRKEFEKLSPEDLAEIGDLDATVETQIKAVTTPWFRYFLNYDPSEYLSKTSVPVLAVNGSLDLQVLPDSNLKGIEKNLKKAGNTNYTIKEFEGLNHLFQKSLDGSGSTNEYGVLEETFNLEAMTYIADWVLNFDKK